LTVGCTRPPAAKADAAKADGKVERENWFGLYLAGHKVGFVHEAVTRVQRDGRTLLQFAENQLTRLPVNGQPMTQSADSATLCGEDLAPIEGSFTLTSAGRTTRLTARFGPTSVACVKTTALGAEQQTAEIPPDAKLVADERLLIGRLKVGQTVDLWQFNPVTVKVEKHTLTAQRREPLALVGQTIDALVVDIRSPWVLATAWVDADGRVRQMEAKVGEALLTFREEPQAKAIALEDPAGQSIDLLTATAIRPDKPIANPRDVGKAVFRVKGLAVLTTVPEGHWQRLRDLGDDRREVTINAAAPNPEPAPTDGERTLYLKATPYIQSDHADIRRAATEAVDGAPDAEAKARHIQQWVNRRIKWQSDIGLFRSALEVLHDPAGVCRDAAALYAALARAAGVPTRVCGGLTFVGDRFLGHAWAESWTGRRWLPLDATLSQTFVDATHIKLAQGAEYTELFTMLPALGNLQVEVVEVQPAKK
jgi:hypothetical protein